MSEKNITIIDADSIVYIIAYKFKDALKITTGTKIRLLASVDSFINRILKDTNADEYLGFHGMPGGKPCFRYEVAETVPYKHSRGPKEDWFILYRPLILKQLEESWKFTPVEGYEADDYVCQAACLHRDLNSNVTIAGVDKDIRQVTGVSHYNYNPNKFVKTKITKYTDIEARHQLYSLVLEGDVSDGFGGIPGVGKVKADEILKDCTNDYSFFRKTVEAFHNYFKTVILEKSITRSKKEIIDDWKINNPDKKATAKIKTELFKDLEPVFDSLRESFKTDSVWKSKFKEMYTLAKLPDTGTYRSDIIIPIALKNKFKVNTMESPPSIKSLLDSIT